MPSDIDNPFIKSGLGSVTGLSVLEHVAWATSQTHNALDECAAVKDNDLYESLRFECATDPNDIYRSRYGLLEECLRIAVNLEGSHAEWAAGAGPGREPLATKLHGPFLH